MEQQALVSSQAWVLAVGGTAAAIALLHWLGQRAVSLLPVLSALLAEPGGAAWELSHPLRRLRESHICGTKSPSLEEAIETVETASDGLGACGLVAARRVTGPTT